MVNNTKSYDNRRTYHQAPGADGVFASAAAAVLPGTSATAPLAVDLELMASLMRTCPLSPGVAPS